MPIPLDPVATPIDGSHWQAPADGRFAPRQPARPIMTVADEQLVAQAQAGDRAAFEELVRRHADRLHVVVLRLTGSNEEAEEVTQEAFLRAWRGLHNFKGEAQFFTWLYRIGVNEARRRGERRSARGTTASLEAHPFEPRDPGPGPARVVEHRDLRAALEDAVRALEPDYRTPLVLRDIEGLSTAEAAEIMGLGQAAFKSRLHRARLAVRAAVDNYLPEDGT
jgi:RNA polymerase sigma-70 factor, ECF subfamily